MNPMQSHQIFVSDRNNALNTLAYELAARATNGALFSAATERGGNKEQAARPQGGDGGGKQNNKVVGDHK